MSLTDRTAALLSHISFTPGDPAPALVLPIGRTLNTLAKQDETQRCTPGQGTVFSRGEDGGQPLRGVCHPRFTPLCSQPSTAPAQPFIYSTSGPGAPAAC